MEITPNELRDTEIATAFRGYDTNEVHELLDRAADTIEALHARVSELGNAVATPAPPAPAPESATDAAARTLALAQRVADETVEEAQSQATAIVAEAETTRASLISDAEAEVRRIQETERARVEAEIAALDARRLDLDAAVDELERFEDGYRQRLHAMLRDDLERLTAQPSAQPGARPHLATGLVTPDLDPASTTAAIDAVVAPDAPAPPIETSTGTDGVGGLDQADGASADVGDPEAVDDAPTPVIGASPLIGSALDSDPAPTIDLAQEQAAERAALESVGSTSARAEASVPTTGSVAEVDDDDFFASLREATGEPAANAGEARLFDNDDDRDSSFRDVFKRRR